MSQNKTVTLTPDEVDAVRELVERRRYEIDDLLSHGYWDGSKLTKELRIEEAHTAESVLRKLEGK